MSWEVSAEYVQYDATLLGVQCFWPPNIQRHLPGTDSESGIWKRVAEGLEKRFIGFEEHLWSFLSFTIPVTSFWPVAKLLRLVGHQQSSTAVLCNSLYFLVSYFSLFRSIVLVDRSSGCAVVAITLSAAFNHGHIYEVLGSNPLPMNPLLL